MKRSFLLMLAASFLLLSCDRPVPVDSIFFNGKIFSARAENDFVEAMAIKNGKIIAVGSTEEILRKYHPEDSSAIDLAGKLLVPGFHDAHLHFWNGARLQHQIDLRGITSLEAALQKIKNAVSQTNPGEWVIGRGWDHELWESKQLPR